MRKCCPMKKFEWIVPEHCAGKRLDCVLTDLEDTFTRSYAQQLITQGHVQYNHKQAQKSVKVKQGDIIAVFIPEPKAVALQAENIPLNIVYEDEALLVVNKPKGLVVHPAAGNEDGTLVNALLHHCKGNLSAINGEIRPGIVHRIDKDTSGLLVVAKDNETHLHLSKQFAEHSITRIYQTVVYGGFSQNTGQIEGLLGRHPIDRKKIAVVQKNGKYAFTSFEVVQPFGAFTHLAVQLKTGRTHQIRVHMASIGHPVAGDAVYGPRKVISALQGQCLHAGTLGFLHPKTNQFMKFESELPDYFQKFIRQLS